MDTDVNASLQIVFSLDTVCEDFELDKTEREAVMKINSNLETILPNLTNEQKVYISNVFLATEHTEACVKLSELLFDEDINLSHNYEKKIRLNAAYALAIQGEFQSSISSLNDIILSCDGAKEDHVYFDTLEAKAHCLLSVNNAKSALELHQEVLGYRLMKGLTATAAKSLISIGKIHIKNSNYTVAMNCCKDAVSLLRPMGNSLTLAYALVELSKLQKQVNSMEDAEISLDEARIICEQVKSNRGLGLVMMTSVEFEIKSITDNPQTNYAKLDLARRCFEIVGDFRRIKKIDQLLQSCIK